MVHSGGESICLILNTADFFHNTYIRKVQRTKYNIKEYTYRSELKSLKNETVSEVEYLGYAVGNLSNCSHDGESVYEIAQLKDAMFNKEILYVKDTIKCLNPWTCIERYPIANVGIDTTGDLDLYMCTALGPEFSMEKGEIIVEAASYKATDNCDSVVSRLILIA